MHHRCFRLAGLILLALALMADLAAPPAAHAGPPPVERRCFVDASRTAGANDGTSWTDAYTDLQSALAITECTEIWVAAGVYKPDGASPGDRSLSFVLKSGVEIYGGFLGTEGALGERDWAANVTILSGEIGTGATNDNSYHVVTGGGTDATAVLDGFTVTAGYANGTWPDYDGGGMYNVNGSSPTLTNVTFSGNSAMWGGGMFNNGSSPTLTNVTFEENTTGESGYGGGMFNQDASSPLLNNVTFEGNSAGAYGYAGGMGNYYNSSPTLTNVTFEGNSAGNYGGGMYNMTGSSPTLTNVTFEGNSTGEGGSGGGMYNNSGSSPALTDVTFEGNSTGDSGYGGGMHNSNSSPTLTQVTFSGNSASYGGGMYNSNSSPTLTQVTFSGNSASYGGGMYNDGSSPGLTNVTFQGNSTGAGSGGGMFNSYSSPTLTNVTFQGNGAGAYGGGMYNLGGSPLIRDSIFWGDTASTDDPEFHNSSSTPTITDSIVQGSGGSSSWDSSFGTDGGGNLDADPKLGPLADNGGYTQTLALLPGSTAIDAGNADTCADTDQRGVTRPQGPACDMGAFEAERASHHIRADFEGDSTSDLGYFHDATGLWGILQSSHGFSYDSPFFVTWGQTGDIVTPGDYDGDGLIDPTVRTPPAGGQSAAYLMLFSSTGYDFGKTLTVPAGWPAALGDTPVIGDFNGDGISDPAIWRGNTAVWIIPLSPTFGSYQFFAWGASGDTPVGADVDGDGQTDVGYWRPSTGEWGFLQSTHSYSYGSALFFSWGASGDIPVMADYDGDSLADPAVVIPPAGGQSRAYRILLSTLAYDTGQSVTIPAGWPALNDTPVPGDYDGDGKADAGIWRANSGVWIIPESSTNNSSYLFAAWGASGDQPIH